MLRVPSLNPIRLRGVSWSAPFDVALPKPSCDQRITTVPRPRRARFRIAWNAATGSSEQACTHRSPPVRAGSRFSGGSMRQVGQRGRTLAGQAEPVVEQRRPEADRDREVGRRRAVRLAGVGRRRRHVRAVAGDQLPGGHRRGGLRPDLQQILQRGLPLGERPVDGQVVRGERQARRRRRGDAGLGRAEERHRLRRRRGRRRSHSDRRRLSLRRRSPHRRSQRRRARTAPAAMCAGRHPTRRQSLKVRPRLARTGPPPTAEPSAAGIASGRLAERPLGSDISR